MGFFRKKTDQREDTQGALFGFDYADREAREKTVGDLYTKAKNARTGKEAEWVKCNDYYNFLHDVSDEVRTAVRDAGIGWDPAVVPDPFIMVESQIDPVVPEPEFRGRDDDLDSQKAKQREYAVKYVCQRNRLEDLNTANERRLKKLGDAFWKVYWDEEMPCGPYRGDIRVRDVPVEALYPDPTAGADGLQAGQYVDYVYSLHKVVFWQRFGAELEARGLTLEDVSGGYGQEQGGLFDMQSPNPEADDTVQVIEHWFKHPVDWNGVQDSDDLSVTAGGGDSFPLSGAKGDGGRRADDIRPYGHRRESGVQALSDEGGREVHAGEIGCSIQAGGHEVRFIPDYWKRTGEQCKLFPFVHYWCVRDENEFYNKSELFSILPMVDAADRELSNALLNDAFTANDIILMEENALADGEEMTNVPGALVKVRQNAMGKVARLGGLHDGRNAIPMMEWLLGQVQRTNRNFETNQGKASSSVKTATELGMLRADVDGQMEIKKADRLAGFVRLYELIDWTVLEFYDDARILFLGGEGPGEEPVVLSFRADDMAAEEPAVVDPMSGAVLKEAQRYFPSVDVTVNAGDGIIRSKAATLQALEKLAVTQVTPDNFRLLSAMLEVLDIPQKQAILEEWEKKFAPKVPPEVTAALENDPRLLELVEGFVRQTGAGHDRMAGMPSGAGMPTMGGMPLPGMGPGMGMTGGVPI